MSDGKDEPSSAAVQGFVYYQAIASGTGAWMAGHVEAMRQWEGAAIVFGSNCLAIAAFWAGHWLSRRSSRE